MKFHLRRYGRALRGHKQWALLVLLSLVSYLILAAVTDVTFSVSQNLVGYAEGLPVAAANSPVDTLRLSDVVADPDLLFLDGFALLQLQKKLRLMAGYGGLTDEDALRRAAHSTLSLTTLGNAGLRLNYTGEDATLGRALVVFYTERLLKRMKEGVARTTPGLASAPLTFQADGDSVVVIQRSLWSAERIRPAGIVLCLSSLGVLVLIAIVELLDPSFKSERQMARYLGIPVLGALPDGGPLVRRLPK